MLKHLGNTLGILQSEPENFLKGFSFASEDEKKKFEELIKARNKARELKDWAESDRIRDELSQMNIVLEDSSKGTIWRKK